MWRIRIREVVLFHPGILIRDEFFPDPGSFLTMAKTKTLLLKE
jgi:hypothetical protein